MLQGERKRRTFINGLPAAVLMARDTAFHTIPTAARNKKQDCHLPRVISLASHKFGKMLADPSTDTHSLINTEHREAAEKGEGEEKTGKEKGR